LTKRGSLPEKRQVVFHFADRTSLAISFWWFGYVHYVAPDELAKHKMTRDLGPNAIDVDAPHLERMIAGRRGQVKAFLLDQTNLAGIGNAYIHDILFLARLHPERKLSTLTADEITGLAKAIEDGLLPSIKQGGAFYELNLYGRKGGFTKENIIIGYREGEPCPECGTLIKKIRTGSTSTFICPTCQPVAHRRSSRGRAP
ncbi:MAG TPA: zinc finger domain-containing protein, partial [bacterium]|nr:zinc finger domain-containing protein [bacterium]